MNRTLRAITAVIFVGVITFCSITLCQNAGRRIRVDITDQKLYTLSEGSKAILGKLNQPLKLKLFYTKTAAIKAPDQIRYYNNYFYFVETLLKEYAGQSHGMISLEVIDPRPFSDEEEEALRYGLRRFPISEEENFFFGLVLQTQFGVVKNIPFFPPDRQNFVEYDISYLIETAITREKKRIGVLTSLAVMGEDVSGYMARLMRMQGRMPRPAWTVVHHLQQQYEVRKVESDVNEISDVDVLLVIHPAGLAEKTLFAIDQFVLSGGRAVICVDPRCFMESTRDPLGREAGSPSSDLNRLLRTWGVEMLEDTFAGDRSLALYTQVEQNRRLEKLIGYLSLNQQCFGTDNVITANLNEVRLLFPGALRKTSNAQDEKGSLKITPLLQTTQAGNTWKVEGPWDWVRIVPERMLTYFTDGKEPVAMAYLITGRFKSGFPEGIQLAAESKDEDSGEESKADDANQSSSEKQGTRTIKGLAEAATDCAVIVIADVDFITDVVAYRDTMFGMKIAVANNSDFLFNAIDDLSGSGDLIGIRSRGNFRRPFDVVEKIRLQAEQETAQEIAKINSEIAALQRQLQEVVSSARKGEEELVAASIVDKQRELEFQIRVAQRRLREVQRQRFQKIEQLGKTLQNINMWSASAVILVIAIVLSIRRSVVRGRYVSHASDA